MHLMSLIINPVILKVAVKSLLASSASKDAVEDFTLETAIMTYSLPDFPSPSSPVYSNHLCRTLRHPNIVMFMGSCFDPIQKEMLLVMEFCSHGSLHDILHNKKVRIFFKSCPCITASLIIYQMTLSYELLLHMACQAAQGMNFLHQSDPPIIHCDLKVRLFYLTFHFLNSKL